MFLSHKSPKQKGIGFIDKNLLRFIRDPHYLNCFSAPRQGLLYRSGFEYQECSFSANKYRDRFIINLKKFL